MEKILIAVAALIVGILIGGAWWAASVKDEEQVNWSECVPVYYGGLECCK